MRRIVDWLRQRLLGPDPPQGRLDRERVLEIARAAAAAAGYPEAAELWTTDLQTRGSAKIWVVSTPTIGSGLGVKIDDATEAVLSVRRWGLR
jgi:hypothetical protein